MFISRRHHTQHVAQAQQAIADRDAQIADLKLRLDRTEKAAHQLVEQTRYALESAIWQITPAHPPTSERLRTIAHALPYVFSGRRGWKDYADSHYSGEVLSNVRRISRTHGFELPADPLEAVISLLQLSGMLFDPSHSIPVESLRMRFPLQDVPTPQP